MHALRLTWKKIIRVNSPLLRTNGVRGTVDCAKAKRIQNVLQTISSCAKVLQLFAPPFPFSQDYLIHTVSTDGTGLIYFSQARIITMSNLSVSTHLVTSCLTSQFHSATVSNNTHSHLPRSGDIDAFATNVCFLSTRAEP